MSDRSEMEWPTVVNFLSLPQDTAIIYGVANVEMICEKALN
jgi:hypothetical protein